MRCERLEIISLFSFSLALAVGCGGGHSAGSPDGSPAGNPIDCTWLTGPNCYKSTFSPALGCLPASTARGMMSVNGKTCTYASGQVITFVSPLTWPLPSDTLVSFTLTSGGTQCLQVNQTSTDSFTLTTSAGTFEWTAANGAASAVCPDGSTYAASGSSLAQAELCASMTTLGPGASVGRGSTDVSFALDGTGVGPSALLSIFDCQM